MQLVIPCSKADLLTVGQGLFPADIRIAVQEMIVMVMPVRGHVHNQADMEGRASVADRVGIFCNICPIESEDLHSFSCQLVEICQILSSSPLFCLY